MENKARTEWKMAEKDDEKKRRQFMKQNIFDYLLRRHVHKPSDVLRPDAG